MSTAGPAINRERQTRPRLTDAGVTSRSYQTAPVVRGAFAYDPQIAPIGVRSPEATRAYLTTNLEHWDRFGFGLWVLRTRDGKFAGRAGIRHVVVEGVFRGRSRVYVSVRLVAKRIGNRNR
jgi:hypothetical protein